MSEIHFTDGNLIILYAIHNNSSLTLPSHILERIEHCARLYQVILKSKPDSHKTIILVIAESHYSELIKKELIDKQINKEIFSLSSIKSIREKKRIEKKKRKEERRRRKER